jgi:hypothetical protein
MQRHLILAIVVLVTLAAGATPAAGQETVTLTVLVVSDDSMPVVGATIDATWEGGSTTATTASNGKAFVDVPKGADVRIAAESERFIRNRPMRVENVTDREVTVEVARKGQLTVRLVDTEGPVEDARVRLWKNVEIIASGRTDADGYYVSPTIEQGDYVVGTIKNGYYRNASPIEVGTDTALTDGLATVRRPSPIKSAHL